MSEEAEPTSKPALEPIPEANASELAKDKGVITGSITYPWGIVKGAKVTVGENVVLSNNDGKYEVSALEPGPYDIAAEASFPGYEATPQEVEVLAGETKTVDIYLDSRRQLSTDTLLLR